MTGESPSASSSDEQCHCQAAASSDGARAAGDLIVALRTAGRTVAVAESLTGGAVCALLTRPPGASEAVLGGVVAYATELKATLLGVDAAELGRTGPVTARVAVAMAQGVRSLLGADVGLATTGEAGPDSSSGAPVGTVFVAAALPDGHRVRELSLSGDRAEIRAASVSGVIELALAAMHGEA